MLNTGCLLMLIIMVKIIEDNSKDSRTVNCYILITFQQSELCFCYRSLLRSLTFDFYAVQFSKPKSSAGC